MTTVYKIGKYIPENLKKKNLDNLEKIKNTYIEDIKNQEKIIENINKEKQQAISNATYTLKIDEYNHKIYQDNLKLTGNILKFIYNFFSSIASKIIDIFIKLSEMRGILVQYILLILFIVFIIVLIYYGFGNSSSSSVIKSQDNKNSPSDFINANNIYKDNNGFMSKIIPKNLYYSINSFKSTINNVFYNKDYILSNSTDRTKKDNMSRYDDMINIPYYDKNQFMYVQSYLIPKNIEWVLPEKSYINSDISKLPDFLKKYTPPNTISLNDKNTIIFKYTLNDSGIWELNNPVFKNNSNVNIFNDHTITTDNIIKFPISKLDSL